MSRRRVFEDNGMVCLEEDGFVCMKLDCYLDVGFGKPAMSMNDEELWQYYERRKRNAAKATRA